MGLGEKDNSGKALFSSHRISGTYLPNLCKLWSPGWDDVGQVSSLPSSFPLFYPVWTFWEEVTISIQKLLSSTSYGWSAHLKCVEFLFAIHHWACSDAEVGVYAWADASDLAYWCACVCACLLGKKQLKNFKMLPCVFSLSSFILPEFQWFFFLLRNV